MRKTVTFTCPVCKQPKTISEALYKSQGGKYCSRACFRELFWAAGRVKVTCYFCGDSFVAQKSKFRPNQKRKFCGSKCYTAWCQKRAKTAQEKRDCAVGVGVRKDSCYFIGAHPKSSGVKDFSILMGDYILRYCLDNNITYDQLATLAKVKRQDIAAVLYGTRYSLPKHKMESLSRVVIPEWR